MKNLICAFFSENLLTCCTVVHLLISIKQRAYVPLLETGEYEIKLFLDDRSFPQRVAENCDIKIYQYCDKALDNSMLAACG